MASRWTYASCPAVNTSWYRFYSFNLYKKETDYIIIMEKSVEKDFTTIGKRAHWLLRGGGLLLDFIHYQNEAFIVQ
jgi:hypothetical protein